MVTLESAHVDVVHISPECSYNVATGDPLITADHDGVKRCYYILFACCRTSLHKHDFYRIKIKVNIYSSPEKSL